ncbi:hypothetical protein N9815_01920, partial [Flavobacteriales bacterium]|nr:hypothetical protein [Flavobacteriales bacterium]
GTGGYISLGYATLDDVNELYLPKFLDFTDPTNPTPYVYPPFFGNPDGTDSAWIPAASSPTGQTELWNIPNNPSYSNDVNMVFNISGALADISWLEAGEVPMVSFHCENDPYVPIDTGDVIVQNTGDFVVEVMGSRVVQHYANQYSNNDPFALAGISDVYTTAANSNNGGLEGLNVFITPQPSTTPNAFGELAEEQGSPWDWWDNTAYGIQAQAVNGIPGITSPAFFAANAILGNPNMSAANGNLYLDTIQGYLNPRMYVVLNFGYVTSGCTDSSALNYNYLANLDDGTCCYLNQDPASAQEIFDINGISTMVGPKSFMWDLSSPQFEVPKGGGKHSIFAHEYWFGGVDNGGQLRVAAQTYKQGGSDFWAGPKGATSCDSIWDRVWKINKTDVDDHIINFNSSNYSMLDVIENWPAHGDTTIGQAFYLAPFIDANANNIYDPFQGDYPDIKGDQALYIIRNDVGNLHSETGAEQMGIEQHLMFYGYKCDDNLAINNSLFVNMKIYNRGPNTLNDFYAGTWLDPDLGFYLDDYVGCNVEKDLGYVYNGDNMDEGPAGYGINPPAQGLVYLNQSMSKFVYYNNDATVQGNPNGGADIYNYLRGIWRDNVPMTFGGDGHGAGSGSTTIQSNYMFPGNTDPAFTGQSWTEQTAGNIPADRRFLMSAGPIDLNTGDVFSLDYAFVFARDYDTSGTNNSVALLFDYVDYVKDFYQNNTLVACNCTDSTAVIDSTVMVCNFSGCMDSLAYNYSSYAIQDDGSCCYLSSCTDPLAFNYDPLACYDDNSCEYIGLE